MTHLKQNDKLKVHETKLLQASVEMNLIIMSQIMSKQMSRPTIHYSIYKDHTQQYDRKIYSPIKVKLHKIVTPVLVY